MREYHCVIWVYSEMKTKIQCMREESRLHLGDWRGVSSSKTVSVLANLGVFYQVLLLRMLNLQACSHSKSCSSVNLMMKLQGRLPKCCLSSSYSALGNRGFSQIPIIAILETDKLNIMCVIGRSTSSPYWYWQTNKQQINLIWPPKYV